MTRVPFFLFCFFVASLFTGCATVMKGYYDEVPVLNYSEGVMITNQYGARIPVVPKHIVKTNRSANPYDTAAEKTDTVGRDYVIYLDSSERQILTVNTPQKSKIIIPQRKIGIGWLVLDTVLLYPLIIDAYTGAWHQFEKVDAAFE
jgi:hypothetical protein